MTSCVGASWERGKTEGTEPGTEVGKPGGRFWCRAGCPRPGETWHSSQLAQGRQEAPQSWPGTGGSQASHTQPRA